MITTEFFTLNPQGKIIGFIQREEIAAMTPDNNGDYYIVLKSGVKITTTVDHYNSVLRDIKALSDKKVGKI